MPRSTGLVGHGTSHCTSQQHMHKPTKPTSLHDSSETFHCTLRHNKRISPQAHSISQHTSQTSHCTSPQQTQTRSTSQHTQAKRPTALHNNKRKHPPLHDTQATRSTALHNNKRISPQAHFASQHTSNPHFTTHTHKPHVSLHFTTTNA